jgi:hypothetical protein
MAVQHPSSISEWLGKAREDSLRRDLDVGRLLDSGEDNCELIAAKARDRVGVPHCGPQAICNLQEQSVASIMAKAVIDPLQMVEVEHHQRETAPRRFAPLDFGIDLML